MTIPKLPANEALLGTVGHTVEMREQSEMRFLGYREAARARLHELIAVEGLAPSHPLIEATQLHLSMTTAAAEAARHHHHPTPNPAQFYLGCRLYYSVPAKPATPSSP